MICRVVAYLGTFSLKASSKFRQKTVKFSAGIRVLGWILQDFIRMRESC